MKIKQSALPFLVLLLFLTIGIPLIDQKMKRNLKDQIVEIEVKKSPVVLVQNNRP